MLLLLSASKLYVCVAVSITCFGLLSSIVTVLNVCSGDRTPKQKVKLKVTEENLLNLMLKYNGRKPRSEVLNLTA